MANRSTLVFKFLQIIAWVIFVGLCIEAGGLLVNFFFSLYKPEFVRHLYQKLDLSEMYSRSSWAFFGMYSFILLIAILKAYLFYIVIRLLHRIDMDKPFNQYVSIQFFQMSYFTFSIGFLSFIARHTAKSLIHYGYAVDGLNPFWEDSQAFVLMSAVIYMIAAIFKRGVDLQAENDLTV